MKGFSPELIAELNETFGSALKQIGGDEIYTLDGEEVVLGGDYNWFKGKTLGTKIANWLKKMKDMNAKYDQVYGTISLNDSKKHGELKSVRMDCEWCQDSWPKEDLYHDDHYGWICPECVEKLKVKVVKDSAKKIDLWIDENEEEFDAFSEDKLIKTIKSMPSNPIKEMIKLLSDEELYFVLCEFAGLGWAENLAREHDIQYVEECMDNIEAGKIKLSEIEKIAYDHLGDDSLTILYRTDNPEVKKIYMNIIQSLKKSDVEDSEKESVIEEQEDESCHSCGWCKEVFPESEMVYEKDFGWLCDSCVERIKEHEGEDSLDFIHDSKDDKLIEKYIDDVLWSKLPSDFDYDWSNDPVTVEIFVESEIEDEYDYEGIIEVSKFSYDPYRYNDLELKDIIIVLEEYLEKPREEFTVEDLKNIDMNKFNSLLKDFLEPRARDAAEIDAYENPDKYDIVNDD